MNKLILGSVGDGMFLGLLNYSNARCNYLQIDCASKEEAYVARSYSILKRVSIDPFPFLLSHFHYDHYSGLIKAYKKHDKFNIGTFYFPKIPKIVGVDTGELLRLNLFFESVYAFTETGLLIIDLIQLVKDVSFNSGISIHPLSSGDVFSVGGLNFKVIWPPKTIIKSESNIQKRVIVFIEEFRKFLESNPEIKDIYDELTENINTKEYLEEHSDDRFTDGKSNKGSNIPDCWETKSEERCRKEMEIKARIEKLIKNLDEGTKKSLKSFAERFRKITNSLSLVFFSEDNFILFLGDLENKDIGMVGKELLQSRKTKFDILITPHHGTHWNDVLFNFRFTFALSSNGSKLYKKFRREFCEISKCSISTHLISEDVHFHHIRSMWVGNLGFLLFEENPFWRNLNSLHIIR